MLRLPGRKKKDFEALFLTHLNWIERTSRFVARSHGYSPDDTQEFCSLVKEKILDNDYAVLRKFQGKSSLPLYLKTVIHRLYIDLEISRHGKWRPSVTARNMGTMAVQLEELLFRQGRSFDEACHILTSQHGQVDRDELHQIAGKLPKRWGKSTVQVVSLDDSAAEEPYLQTEERDPKTSEWAQRLASAVSDCVARLSGTERLILKMRFQDDFTYEAIGRCVRMKKLHVYWRLNKILSDIQENLLSQGLSESAVQEILKHEGKTIDIDFLVCNETQQS